MGIPTNAVIRTVEEQRRAIALNAAALSIAAATDVDWRTSEIISRARQFETYLRGDAS